jgi:hypothetical protein
MGTATFPNEPDDESNHGSDRAPHENAAHGGFKRPIVHVGREPFDQKITSERANEIPANGAEQPNPQSFHRGEFQLVRPKNVSTDAPTRLPARVPSASDTLNLLF